MDTIKVLNGRILAITEKINTERPELLGFLNKMPVTVPNGSSTEMTASILRNYCDSLTSLLTQLPAKGQDVLAGEKQVNMHTENIYMEQRINKKYIRANRINVCYEESGTGETPIVFIHGFPFNRTLWQTQLDFFKTTNRVIAYDVRGFGESTDESAEVSIKLFADDLIAFLDALKIEKAILCGLSMGGYIALNAVLRFPDRIEALVLCDTQCVADTITDREKRYKIIQTIENEGLKSFAESFSKVVFHPDTLVEKKELVAEIEGIILSPEKRSVIGGLMALAKREESCSALASITVPTLIVCGKEDQVIVLAQSEFMHQSIKQSTLRVIERAGHLSNVDRSPLFNQFLEEFINGLENSERFVKNDWISTKSE